MVINYVLFICIPVLVVV